jgi:hypothetical protein
MQRLYTYIATGLIAAVAASAAGAHPAKPKPRSYGGLTSQDLPISLKVSKSGRSVAIKLMNAVDCPTMPAGGYAGTAMFTAPLSARRSFGGSYSGKADLPDDPAIGVGDLTANLVNDAHAKLGRKQAVGAWHSHLTVLDAAGAPRAECDSGTVRFRVKAGGKAVFSRSAVSVPNFG